jgi:hypothetical protein
MDSKTPPDSTDDRRRDAGAPGAEPAMWYSLIPLALCFGGGAAVALIAVLG